MPLSANSIVFLDMTISAKSGITFFEHEKKCVRISTVFRHCVRAFLLCSSTFCVHFYYYSTVFQHCLRAFPLLREAFWIVLDCIPALLACISIAFLLCSSTFLRAHFYGIPALGACIPTNLQHSLHAFLLHFYCISFISQHFHPCAFLLCSSTVGVHFYYVQAHSAAHSALIATVFRHCARAFLLYSSTFLVAFTHVCM